MPPQENTSPVPQFVPPVVAPLPKPHKATWITVVSVIGYVLSVLVSVGMVGGMGIGCAFGNSGFMCNRLLPFSVGVGLLLVVILLAHISKSARKLAKRLYWIIFLVWMLLIGLIAVLPERARQTYVYGMTREACEAGRPTVPWGYIYKDKNNCFMSIGECLLADTYNEYCFQRDIARTMDQITDITQCENFKYGSTACKHDFAVKTNDVSHCKDLKHSEVEVVPEADAWDRYSCAKAVAFQNEYFTDQMTRYLFEKLQEDRAAVDYNTKKVKYGREFCGRYDGLKQDVCLFQVATDTSKSTNTCGDIKIDWLSDSCVAYIGDRLE